MWYTWHLTSIDLFSYLINVQDYDNLNLLFILLIDIL